MKWSFLNSGFHSGVYNMELDAHLASRLQQGAILTTLRVYGWNPPAISIGYHQEFDDFDAKKLNEAGIDIVRRPTGGRAILHAHELTYSVVVNVNGKGLREIYRSINEGLLCGLNLLGIKAHLTETEDDLQTAYKHPSAVPCFATSAKCEIHAGGRKIVGSAQRRFGDVVLQHGSFLLGPQHNRIAEFLSTRLQTTSDLIEDHLQSRAVDAESILRRRVTFEEAAANIKSGFEEALGISFVESQEIPLETIMA